jgi:hypothetical protein
MDTTLRIHETRHKWNCGGYWPSVLEQTLMVDRWELSVKWRFNGWSTVIKILLYWQLILAMFASVIHELCFACSWITLILDPTVWLGGARLGNTFILPSFPGAHAAPWFTHHSKSLFPLHTFGSRGILEWFMSRQSTAYQLQKLRIFHNSLVTKCWV